MPAKRVPRGKGLPAFDGDVPVPSQAEIDALVINWNERVPRYAGLLEAQPLGSDKPSRFWYDEINQRYIRRSNGRIVTEQELRAAFLAFQKSMSER